MTVARITKDEAPAGVEPSSGGSPDAKPREQVAVHEAGHAIAAHVFCRRAYHPVTIIPTEWALGSAWVGGSLEVAGLCTPSEIDAEVQMLIAGLAAEEVIGGVEDAFELELETCVYAVADFPPEHDLSKALAWLAAAGLCDEGDQLHRLGVLYRRTMRFMRHEEVRAAVQVLAERLLETGVIGEIGVSDEKFAIDCAVMKAAEAHVARLRARRSRQRRARRLRQRMSGRAA
jgi:hypothetical protein